MRKSKVILAMYLVALAVMSGTTVKSLREILDAVERDSRTVVAAAAVVAELAGASEPSETRMAVALYRLDRLEEQMHDASAERRWVIVLLIGNLVAIIVSLVTYLFTGRKARGSH